MTTTWPMTANAPPFEVTHPDAAALRAPLLDLWQRNLPTAAEHRFDWLYGSGRSQAWLLGERDASPMGAAGLMRRRTAVEGAVVEGGSPIDLNVDQAQRSVGPALTLVRTIINAADGDGRAILYGMPNRSATAVMKRAGYREIGEFSSWTKLLRTEPTLRGKLRSPLASRLCAPLLDKALQWSSAEWRTRLPANAVAQDVSRFDGRFDALWLRAIARFDVIGERTENYLSWRFTQCPDLNYQIFTLASRVTNELLGYVVWYADEGAVSISDLLAVDDRSTSLLLAEFSRRTRRDGMAAIRLDCFGSTRFYRLLKLAGFHRRQNRHPVLCRFGGEVREQTQAGTNWFLTMADSDTDV